MKIYQLSIRILCSPFILIYGFVLSFVSWMFLGALVYFYHLGCILSYPIIKSINIGAGREIITIDVNDAIHVFSNNYLLNNFLMCSISFWGPFYITYEWIAKGEIFQIN